MRRCEYLRSRQRRGNWFHYYRRSGREVSLGVHGLDPNDQQVFAACCAEHARWQDKPPYARKPKGGTVAWAVDLYQVSRGGRALADGTRQSRDAILRRYIRKQGDRPLSWITRGNIEAALYAKGRHAAATKLKAREPVFAHVTRLGIIPNDPTHGLLISRPSSQGFLTASAEDIALFQARWPVGTTECMAFDLALDTGAPRADLVSLSFVNVGDGLLTFNRQKTDVLCEIPLKPEPRAVLSRALDIAPAFPLTFKGQPFLAAALCNLFVHAAKAAAITARLHGLHKVLCVYWAEPGASTGQIAAIAGHMSLSEVERYTRAADRRRMVKFLVEGA